MSEEFSFTNSMDVKIYSRGFHVANHHHRFCELFEVFCLPDLMPQILQPRLLNNKCFCAEL